MRFYRGMRGLINAPDEKPEITWPLLKRVLRYAKPYRWQIVAMLLLILVQTGVGLLTPLIMRDMIDVTIPAGNLNRLIMLAAALLA
ncbi:MAG: ABC transporter ATP-binding protein, partial [Anaerolineae bacterium]